MLESIAVGNERFGSQHLIMAAVGRVDDDVTENVRLPTLRKIRTAIALTAHRGKYRHITVEYAGLVNLIQRDVVRQVLHERFEKLLVSRNLYGAKVTKQVFSL